MKAKTIQQSTDCVIQFNEDELIELGWKPGDKFSVDHNDDGSVSIKKYAEIELELNDFSREVLESLIVTSIEEDVSVNEVISNILEEVIGEFEI